MNINWKVVRNFILFNCNFDIPISIILILAMTILFRKKSWKKCVKAYLLTFLIASGIHYIFYVIVYHLPPGAEWKIFSMSLLKNAIGWSFYIIINSILWRFIIAIFYKIIPNKILFALIFTITFCLYTLFYVFILADEMNIFDPLLYKIFNKIPNIRY